MRPIVIAAIAAVALAAAPAAAAKEISSVQVCGTDGCTTTKDRALLAALMNGSPTDPPSHPAGAIRLRATVSDGHQAIGRYDAWWVPGTSVIAAEDGSWVDLGPKAAAVLTAAAHEPFPPGRIGAAFASKPAPAPAPQAEAGGGPGLAFWLVVGGLTIVLALGVAWWRGSSPRTT